MKTPWNQDEPLENMIRQIEKCVEFAEQGGAPMSNMQEINISHVIMAQVQVFKDACKD